MSIPQAQGGCKHAETMHGPMHEGEEVLPSRETAVVILEASARTRTLRCVGESGHDHDRGDGPGGAPTASVGRLIVVAGEALIDRIESPDGRVVEVPGGGPYNVARTIARLGGRVAFLGGLSNDAQGARLRAHLESDGVELGLAVATDDPTPIATARLDGHGAATYAFALDGSAAAGLVLGDLPDGLPKEVAAFHVGTLGLVVEPMATTIEALVGSAGRDVLVMVDLNCRPSAIRDPRDYRARIQRVLGRTHVVKASVDDLAYLWPGISPLRAARQVLDRGPTTVLLTDGGRPVRIVSVGAIDELPIPAVGVVDTVGAGDAFGGGFLLTWMAAGLGRTDARKRDALLAATRFAIAVAALTTTRAGAEPPTAAEVAVFLRAGRTATG
jgi:fructokinase